MIDLYCENIELMQVLNEKEILLDKITERLMRCPCCNESDFTERTGGGDYPGEIFFECPNCGKIADAKRHELIYDIALCGADEYWNFDIFMQQRNFEYGEYSEYNHQEQKKRDFNVAEWEKENKINPQWDCAHSKPITSWREYVEETIRDHIKVLDAAIEQARKVPMLKNIFKGEQK